MMQKKMKQRLSPVDQKTEHRRSGLTVCLAGIVLNILLFLMKSGAACLSGSVAITADGFNNLADTGACIVALSGILLGRLGTVRKRPRLLSRAESASGAIIATAILYMGVRTAADAVSRIISPRHTESGVFVILILVVTVAVKGAMFLYYRRAGEQLCSAGIKAAAADSLSDCCATLAIIISAGVERFTGLIVDGYAGTAAAACIIWAGISAWRESLTLSARTNQPDFIRQNNQIKGGQE